MGLITSKYITPFSIYGWAESQPTGENVVYVMASVMQQAITCTIVDPELRRNRASLYHDGLNDSGKDIVHI